MSRLSGIQLIFLTLSFLGCQSLAQEMEVKPIPVDLSTLYGAESNNTGSPIGGGAGYANLLSGGDYNVTDAASFLAALNSAKSGEVIWIEPNSSIDLSGQKDLYIPQGVTIAGNRGQDGAPGPLIFADQLDQDAILFWVQMGARFTGIRIQGPDPDFDKIEASYETSSTVCMVIGDQDVEIDNCEISNFNRGGIEIYPDGSDIHIHHNFLHDIHAYPFIALNKSAPPILVEANIIHWLWHATAGSGYPGTGYEARFNLIIRKKVPDFWLPYDESHAIDMHPYLPVLQERDQRIAGDEMSVHHNTFRSEAGSDPSVPTSFDAKVRGTPRILATFYNNEFLIAKPEQSVVHYDGNVWVYNNKYGPGGTLIEVANETTPQILFQSPPPPNIEVPRLSGSEIPIDISVNTFGELQVAEVTILLNDEEIYKGASAPSPGEIVLKTADLDNNLAQHKLTVNAVDNRGIIATHTTYFTF